MTLPTRSLGALLAAAVVAAGSAAYAHGLLVSVRGEGASVVGRVYYSDGSPGAGEFVELRDLTEPVRRPQSGATDAQGAFRFAGTPGHRYAVVAHGEEGHTTEMQLTLADGGRGRLVDAPAAGSEGPDTAPAWLVIGGLLLLSTLPALWLRRRQLRGKVE